jgi:Branched-chain amino acid ABC-type transport system, permease components
MSFEMFVQHLFNALTLGSLYGLIAIGYTMVYGILRLINFAHGDIFMLGAYLFFMGYADQAALGCGRRNGGCACGSLWRLY